jgi:hypothetical protein
VTARQAITRSLARAGLVSYAAHCPEMWTAEIATGIALTSLGGEHDRRFVVGWERLKREPLLLEAYNALKREYEGAPDADSYQSAKSAFFSALASSDPEQPEPLA